MQGNTSLTPCDQRTGDERKQQLQHEAIWIPEFIGLIINRLRALYLLVSP